MLPEIDQWLCFDCETEFNDADEVMLLTGWIAEPENTGEAYATGS